MSGTSSGSVGCSGCVRWVGSSVCFRLTKSANAAAQAVPLVRPVGDPDARLLVQEPLRDRFDDNPENITPLTLDGTAYIENAIYRDANGSIQLASDYEGIQWLQSNVQGSPIILEGVTPTYRWGGRISINTGLPTVIGWQWHQEQQRWDYRQEVGERIRDVQTIYNTLDSREALLLMRKYGVQYVYVGELERLYFSEEGLRKFETDMSRDLSKVFENQDVVIYKLATTIASN